MSLTSIYNNWDNILQVMQQNIQALNLLWQGNPVQIVVRKQLTKEDEIDPPTQISLYPDPRPPIIERYGMKTQNAPNGIGRTIYYTDVAIITPNTGDNQLNLETYQLWLQQISQLFSADAGLQTINGGVDDVQDCRAIPLRFLDPSKIKAGYDVFGVCVAATITGSLTG